MGEFVDRLLSEPDEQPQSWKGKEGDLIVGRVLSYRRATASSERGGDRRVWVMNMRVQECRGEVMFGSGTLAAIWILHSVLEDEIGDLKPLPGEIVGIRRLTDGGGYRRFKVMVDRKGDLLPDWENMGGEPQRDTAMTQAAALAETGDDPPFD